MKAPSMCPVQGPGASTWGIRGSLAVLAAVVQYVAVRVFLGACCFGRLKGGSKSVQVCC